MPYARRRARTVFVNYPIAERWTRREPLIERGITFIDTSRQIRQLSEFIPGRGVLRVGNGRGEFFAEASEDWWIGDDVERCHRQGTHCCFDACTRDTDRFMLEADH